MWGRKNNFSTIFWKKFIDVSKKFIASILESKNNECSMQ
jgi:hypothetical protein